MPQPNELPLVCLPAALSDEAAAQLVDFLHELTDVLERHYYVQLRRHYHPTEPTPHDPDDPASASTPADPPF